jgi:hypothetical protein
MAPDRVRVDAKRYGGRAQSKAACIRAPPQPRPSFSPPLGRHRDRDEGQRCHRSDEHPAQEAFTAGRLPEGTSRMRDGNTAIGVLARDPALPPSRRNPGGGGSPWVVTQVSPREYDGTRRTAETIAMSPVKISARRTIQG